MNLGAENNRFDTIFCKDIDVENGIVGGGGVKQTILYSGSNQVTSLTDTNSYNMTSSIDNYDYLLVTIRAYRTGVEDATTIVVKDEDKYYSWETCYSGNADPSRFSAAGFVRVVNETLEFGLRYRGNNISYVYLSSVVGIKYIDPDIKNVTSLDETLLYSGNIEQSADTIVEYSLSDSTNNYEYLLISYGSYTSEKIDIIKINDIFYSSGIFFCNYYNNSHIISGWIMGKTDKTKVDIRIATATTDNKTKIKSIIGIKKKSLSTADIAEMAMPSDVYITLENNTTSNDKFYTAPANGFIFATCDKWVQVWSDFNALIGSSSGYYGGSVGIARILVPVKKGATINYYGGATTTAKFIYSVGDAKALGLI